LANVRLLSRDTAGALQVVKQGLSRNPGSPLLNLLAARVCSLQGDSAGSASYFAQVQKQAPDLASRFPDLAASGGTGASQRAAAQSGPPAVTWGDQ
ncbi:MAG TPA: hypothetical protein VMF68_05725, partial [Spirochaetia bacterium]|nr:hypothetical protein [Spirochaetia bacterium]